MFPELSSSILPRATAFIHSAFPEVFVMYHPALEIPFYGSSNKEESEYLTYANNDDHR